MRVISGIAKGKKLVSSNDKKIRPTSDKVKMAIYNIIEHGNISFSLYNNNVLVLLHITIIHCLEFRNRSHIWI